MIFYNSYLHEHTNTHTRTDTLRPDSHTSGLKYIGTLRPHLTNDRPWEKHRHLPVKPLNIIVGKGRQGLASQLTPQKTASGMQ